MTHKELVRKMSHWLQYSRRCPVVLSELATQHCETPDVIGFHGAGDSILIECKVTRSDFLADKHKIFRRVEETGVGDVRYFAAPPGVIEVDDLPEGWGLMHVHDHQMRTEREPTRKPSNKRAEVVMLMSAIRRLEISTAVFVRQDIPENDNVTNIVD